MISKLSGDHEHPRHGEGGQQCLPLPKFVLAQGAPVAAVAGDPRNIKVTTPADLAVARALVEATGR